MNFHLLRPRQLHLFHTEPTFTTLLGLRYVYILVRMLRLGRLMSLKWDPAPRAEFQPWPVLSPTRDRFTVTNRNSI